MRLDVYLRYKIPRKGNNEPKIFIREDGQNKQISRKEWDRRFPGQEPFTVSCEEVEHEVYTANITHNLGTMAANAGIYEHLWKPDEVGIQFAQDLIAPLQEGLRQLIATPHHFKQFNPSNGWESYETLVSFVAKYIDACQTYPDAEVSVWR